MSSPPSAPRSRTSFLHVLIFLGVVVLLVDAAATRVLSTGGNQFVTAPPAEPAPPADVLVAARDLPLGTVFTAEEFGGYVKVVKRPKDGLPPNVVTNKEELVGKRITRAVRADE